MSGGIGVADGLGVCPHWTPVQGPSIPIWQECRGIRGFRECRGHQGCFGDWQGVRRYQGALEPAGDVGASGALADWQGCQGGTWVVGGLAVQPDWAPVHGPNAPTGRGVGSIRGIEMSGCIGAGRGVGAQGPAGGKRMSGSIEGQQWV